MSSRPTPILVHLLGAAAAAALAAYWVLRLAAPASPIVAVTASAIAIREPDARLAARMFGDLSNGPAASAVNIQVSGVFAAGRDSSAVIAVEGRPARAVLLGRDVAPGMRLVEVRPDGVTIERDGARSQYAVPPASIAQSSVPSAMFRRDGDTLTAPSQDAPSAAPPAGRSAATSPANLASPASRRAAEEPPMPARTPLPAPNAPANPLPGPGPANSPGG